MTADRSNDAPFKSAIQVPSPFLLYRYRPLRNRREWTQQIMRDGSIWCSSPLQFNDPFECRPRVTFLGPIKEKRRYATQLVRDRFKSFSKAKREKAIAELIGRMESDPVVPSDITANTLKGVGVLSLSEDPRNILMWSHYADGHKGVVFGFEASSDVVSLFSTAHKVNYQHDYPVCNWIADERDNVLVKALLTKSELWSYEREWRVIMRSLSAEQRAEYYRDNSVPLEVAHVFGQEHGEGAYLFPAAALKEVILGAAIASEDREFVIGLARQRSVPIRLMQASLHRESYEVQLSEVNQ